jgi:hypothetical protein
MPTPAGVFVFAATPCRRRAGKKSRKKKRSGADRRLTLPFEPEGRNLDGKGGGGHLEGQDQGGQGVLSVGDPMQMHRFLPCIYQEPCQKIRTNVSLLITTRWKE